MFKNALVSVADKTGLVEFLKPLAAQGLRIVSTGGTARHLRENGISVLDVSEQTGFPEVMDGRVKTLHPHIHMALLARDFVADDLDILKKYKLEPFDLVIGNLYPFEEALADQLDERGQAEFIDIGGPSFLRASAKSYERITVICDPNDYEWVSAKPIDLAGRKQLAAKVFAHTAAYDAMIAQNLGLEQNNPDQAVGGKLIQTLRYGENPQQKASWFRLKGAPGGLHEAQILQGKELSYNNLLDLDAAISTLREMGEEPHCVAVKHNNPCGVASGSSVTEAVQKGIGADPVSVFGGIIASNRTIDQDCARKLGEIFLECIVAPDFTDEALSVLGKKKNLRLLKWPKLLERSLNWQIRSVTGGFLLQEADQIPAVWNSEWKIIGKTPDEKTQKDLLMAWKVCARLKSNAIAIVEGGQTLGLGMGQVNRVDAVEQALGRMRKFHNQVRSPVLASDAFFPFPDSIEIAAAQGVHWVIQPGGSVKDEEVFKRAGELGVNLILTGKRHFLH